GYEIEEESDILVCQSDSMDWRETEERLYQDVAEKGEDLKVRACNTLEGDAVSRMAGGYGMALLGAIVILGGMFFLVHNVMQISMAGDIRQMGLLNTIGATKKQIRGIYFGQIRSILIPGVMLGTLVSVFVLKIWIPGILGNQYLSSFGGAGELSVFRPGILAAAVGFAALLTAGAAAGVVRHVVNASCVESMNYMPSGKMFLSGKKHVPGKKHRSVKMHLSSEECTTCHANEDGTKRSDIKQRGGRRSARSELWYMAWQNLSRNRGQFSRTILSLFLGMEVFLAALVITKGSDYSHVIEKRPDFLIAGEFSSWGKEEGYCSEYKTRDAGEDPMETEGESLYLLAG
ncbi:MAG: ABC transporter permease, partial [Lachnospiraceae bacterium]|nr:ABC transporter permease [Lachnospiraceae bacterium]